MVCYSGVEVDQAYTESTVTTVVVAKSLEYTTLSAIIGLITDGKWPSCKLAWPTKSDSQQ